MACEDFFHIPELCGHDSERPDFQHFKHYFLLKKKNLKEHQAYSQSKSIEFRPTNYTDNG